MIAISQPRNGDHASVAACVEAGSVVEPLHRPAAATGRGRRCPAAARRGRGLLVATAVVVAPRCAVSRVAAVAATLVAVAAGRPGRCARREAAGGLVRTVAARRRLGTATEAVAGPGLLGAVDATARLAGTVAAAG